MTSSVRPATDDDLLAVVRVVDAAMLELDHDAVRTAVGSGDVLVADCEGRVVGVLVLDGDHVDAVAVRRSRRGQGIGTALVEAAADRRDRLTADFDPRVRPFYESLGFNVGRRDGRLWGVREG
ncbi:GNAT family N-acetyltransferase [Salinirarus marinus]|uniref:GNAT family N-acetyltransferase n=1 Tax=Salinirarus marinus TaxID=3068310 RepID=UPI003C6C164B